MPLAANFQFSQSSLQDYSECARRFELKTIQRLRWPAPVTEPQREHEHHMRRGELFHQMIHQHVSNVPAAAITRTITDSDLKIWWERYLASPFNATATTDTPLPQNRYPEVVISAPIHGYRLLAKYDLLAIQPGEKAVIVDWKTSMRRPSEAGLAARMQTLVYRYLLVEAGSHFNGGTPIAPEQIEMVYWFTAEPDNPIYIGYDAATHAQVGETLAALIDDITQREVFDLTTETRRCRFCGYRSLCERGVSAGTLDEMESLEDDFLSDPLDIDFDFEQVAEVEF